uniref:Putative secreted protein n=1 Tax=Anopheles darlingi TaxID=43151 RepID=A0A2M4DCJ4_ANODA
MCISLLWITLSSVKPCVNQFICIRNYPKNVLRVLLPFAWRQSPCWILLIKYRITVRESASDDRTFAIVFPFLSFFLDGIHFS